MFLKKGKQMNEEKWTNDRNKMADPSLSIISAISIIKFVIKHFIISSAIVLTPTIIRNNRHYVIVAK
jgi:hypothetical protein